MASTEIILLALTCTYVARVAFFFIGVARENAKWRKAPYHPTVSVIVPARNEEKNLGACIDALLRMDYPSEKLQIIVVNDRSKDATGAVLDEYARRHQQVIAVEVEDREAAHNLRGKPGALQLGIDRSESEIVLMTDADCEVSKTWASAMCAQFASDNVALVAGLTSVRGNSFSARVQDVEWTFTQTMAAGGVGNGVPLGCFGNNLAVRRSVFEELGGYREIAFSVTEDLALQDAIFNAGYEVRHAVGFETAVMTLPCTTLPEYIKQRHRWVRGGTQLGKRATFFVVSSFALWAGVAIAVYTHSWSWLWLLIGLRYAADGFLISVSAVRMKRKRIIAMIVPAMTLLIMTELLLPILATKKRVTWKEQVFVP